MVGVSQLALIGRMPSMDYASEGDILAACRRREIRAFEQLYKVHGPRLKSIAYHVVGNRQDAEDAVQETFLKAFKAIDGFQGHCTVGTWLCRIVINVCYDLAKKRRREIEMPPEVRATGESPTLRMALEGALKRINPRHRMVFLLFEVEGLRHSDIASIFEIPEGTSKAWLFEAKKELKRLLTEVRR